MLVHMQIQASVCPSVCPQRSFYGLANRATVLTAGLPCTICLSMLPIITPCVLLCFARQQGTGFSSAALFTTSIRALKWSSVVQMQWCKKLCTHFYLCWSFWLNYEPSHIEDRVKTSEPSCPSFWLSKSNANVDFSAVKTPQSILEKHHISVPRTQPAVYVKTGSGQRMLFVFCQPPPSYVGDESSSHFCLTVNSWGG